MAKKPTHYDTLGVSRNAPDEVIRGAYKALAQKNHPDKNLGNPEATNIMQTINQAYDVLSDPGKKADYDIRLNQQEMAAAAQTQRYSHSSSHQSSGSYTPRPVTPYPPQSRGGGVMFLIVVAVAAILLAVFVYNSNSPISVTPRLSASVGQGVTLRPVETFIPKETTPQELAVCVFAAAKTYSVPPSLLLSLLSVEGGTVGKTTPVSNHSSDLGLMQISSFWIPQLAKVWEVSQQTALRRVRDDACVNVGLGAWFLQTALGKSNDLRTQIVLYRTAAHHSDPNTSDQVYVDKVIKMATLYKSIHGPEDLLGAPAAPANNK